MVTVSQRKPHVKPARSIRLALRPIEGNPVVVRIHQGQEEDSYLLYPFAADFGRLEREVWWLWVQQQERQRPA